MSFKKIAIATIGSLGDVHPAMALAVACDAIERLHKAEPPQ